MFVLFTSKLFGTAWYIVIYLWYVVAADVLTSENPVIVNSILFDLAGQLLYVTLLPKPTGQAL